MAYHKYSKYSNKNKGGRGRGRSRRGAKKVVKVITYYSR